MRTVLLLLIFLFQYAWAQTIAKRDVPDRVIYSFQKLHPIVDNVNWEKENKAYVAEYGSDHGDMYDVFNSKGKLIEKREKIHDNDVPKGVINYLNKTYKKEDIKSIYKVTGSGRGTTSYRAAVKGVIIYFDANGNFVKTAER